MEVNPLSNSQNVTVQRNDVDVDVDVEEFFLFNFTKKTNGFCCHTNAYFWIKSTKLAPFTNCSSPFCES